jgi:hypothetical protein
VFNLTTAPWQFVFVKLAKIARFPQKSRLVNRKDRAERNLLFNRSLFQGGRLPPTIQHPLIYPLAAWNLEQHGDRGTVVDSSRRMLKQGRKATFLSGTTTRGNYEDI